MGSVHCAEVWGIWHEGLALRLGEWHTGSGMRDWPLGQMNGPGPVCGLDPAHRAILWDR